MDENAITKHVMYCPACGAENEIGLQFCAVCGLAFAPEPAQEKPQEATQPFAPIEPAKPDAPKPAQPAQPFAPIEPAKPDAPKPAQPTQPFAPIEPAKPDAPKPAQAAQAFAPIAATEEKAPEPESVFAQGLPDWDMLPPQVVVRRKRK